MTIRKFLTATAAAGAIVLAGSGAAFANEVSAQTNVAPGGEVCVDLPATADSVRAEGLGSPEVVFTLTSEGVLLASAPERLAVTTTGAPGAVRLCAANQGASEASVSLYLVNGLDVVDAPVSSPVDAPNPPVVDTPDDGLSVPAPDTPPVLVPSDVQELIDAIQRLVDEIIQQVLDGIGAL